jgi:hypothetical protein
MKVLICHNCAGFGVTVGPVLAPVCEDVKAHGDGEQNPTGLRQESVVYPCQACGGEGFLTIAAAG